MRNARIAPVFVCAHAVFLMSVDVSHAEVLAGQFERMASGWQQGLAIFEEALGKTTGGRQRTGAHDDFAIAEAAGLHFKSVANQIRFVLARKDLVSQAPSQAEREAKIGEIKTLVADEIRNAKRLFTLTREDPRIGFEASNHYYYLPLDLLEKVINCEYLTNAWLPHQSDGEAYTPGEEGAKRTAGTDASKS